MFGRKKRKGAEQDEVEETTKAPARAAEDPWEKLDASKDWREDGPFDISEVDLDADDVERLDFGALIFTPFEGMGMQLQINQQTNSVQAVLVNSGQSAVEVALFAAPSQSSLMRQVRDDMIRSTEQSGGEVTLAEGPFGTEIRRVLPLQDKDGKRAYHISRTWFAEGPGWLLRGVLMGQAGMAKNLEGPAELLYEFFSNIVVNRDESPHVPGHVIEMEIPEQIGITKQQ